MRSNGPKTQGPSPKAKVSPMPVAQPVPLVGMTQYHIARDWLKVASEEGHAYRVHHGHLGDVVGKRCPCGNVLRMWRVLDPQKSSKNLIYIRCSNYVSCNRTFRWLHEMAKRGECPTVRKVPGDDLRRALEEMAKRMAPKPDRGPGQKVNGAGSSAVAGGEPANISPISVNTTATGPTEKSTPPKPICGLEPNVSRAGSSAEKSAISMEKREAKGKSRQMMAMKFLTHFRRGRIFAAWRMFTISGKQAGEFILRKRFESALVGSEEHMTAPHMKEWLDRLDKMFEECTAALKDIDLEWKTDSLQWCCASAVRPK